METSMSIKVQEQVDRKNMIYPVTPPFVPEELIEIANLDGIASLPINLLGWPHKKTVLDEAGVGAPIRVIQVEEQLVVSRQPETRLEVEWVCHPE